ncbi:MAG: aminotransferase class I/II-fold pyridoxal phosphate-dependent enzyme [Microscillaceae bacterium]|nr:aminotransferase class I/II-fold pyridoxal phosphate-dependent enzyme [Microscillaceae bacterium]
MMIKNARIYLSPPHLSHQEMAYIQSALDNNWVAPVGENIDLFERKVAEFTGSKYALALNSGTSAIHLALNLLHVSEGDEVICPTFSFVATANPILYQKATPVFIDSEKDTWNISPDRLEKAIQERIRLGKKPKAIVVVHIYGQAAQMSEIQQIAAYYQIPILEDAAEALGSTYGKRYLGTLGKVGILSFNGNKIITTSAGGMLLCDDKTLIDKGLHLSTQARDTAMHYEHSELGYNYRMSNILAGIGLGQMEVLKERIRQRRANFEFYKNKLEEKVIFQTELKNSYSNRWLTCILTDSRERRDKIHQALSAADIDARCLWKPLHLQALHQKYPYYGEKVAQDLFERGLCLPSGSNLSTEDKERISTLVLKAFD